MKLMKKSSRLLALGFSVIALGLAACSAAPKATLQQKLAAIPAKRLSSYNFDPSSPLLERCGPVPSFFIAYLNQMDGVDYYAEHRLSETEKRLFADCLALLPPALISVFERTLIAFYFVNGFIGGGMADYVLDEAAALFSVMVINPEALERSLSEWLTFRERSAFAPAASDTANHIDLTVIAGEGRAALLYVLLHEGAHIADFAKRYTPFVEPNLSELGFAAAATPFARGVWAAYDKPVAAHDFAGRAQLSFYGLGKKALAPIDEAAAMFKALSLTPFVSLYGSRNWAEDFAEAFVWYYLTRRLGGTYRVELRRAGELVYVHEPSALAAAASRLEALAALAD